MKVTFQDQKDLYDLLISCIIVDMEQNHALTDELAQQIDPLLEKNDFEDIYHIPQVKSFVASRCKQQPDYPNYLVSHYGQVT